MLLKVAQDTFKSIEQALAHRTWQPKEKLDKKGLGCKDIIQRWYCMQSTLAHEWMQDSFNQLKEGGSDAKLPPR